MRTVLLVALGGALSALARYGLSIVLRGGSFPWATWTANLTGCLLLGLIVGSAAAQRLSPALQEAVRTGFLGGYTTFSAFGVEFWGLLLDGQVLLAAGYAMSSLVLGYAFVEAGFLLTGRKGESS